VQPLNSMSVYAEMRVTTQLFVARALVPRGISTITERATVLARFGSPTDTPLAGVVRLDGCKHSYGDPGKQAAAVLVGAALSSSPES